MFKKLVIVGGVLVLFMTACGSGDKKEPSAEAEKTAAPPTAAATVEKDATPVVEPTKKANGGGAIKAVFQPLSIMGGPLFGGSSADVQPGAADVDPDLKDPLLTEEDLPPGYNGSPDGDYEFSVDTPQGHMETAMRLFLMGDPWDEKLAPIVMSAAMAMPPGAMSDFDSSLSELETREFSSQELQELMSGSPIQGIDFREFRLSKAQGLGEGGVVVHMVMDMNDSVSGLDSVLGAFKNGIAVDTYVFKRGERMLMVMTMWPASDAPNVDALALAEIMDGRAQ